MALNFRKFIEGLRIVPKAASTVNEKGDLDVTLSDGKLNYHNGTTASPVVTEDHSATLKEKTIDADLNTISNIENDNIKVGAAIERAKLAAGTASTVVVNDASGVLSDLSLTSAQIILGNDSGIPTATTVTGEVTISDTGVTTVGTVANSVISGLLQTQMEILEVASTITATKSFVKLGSGSGTIHGITEGLDGQHLILTNLTGSAVIIQNQSSTETTEENRILTGTGGAVSLDNNASLFLIYNSSDSRWYVIGGVGGSSSFNAVAGEDITVGDAVYISNGTGTDTGRTAGRVYKLNAKNDDRIEFIGFCLDSALTSGATRVQVAGKLSGFTGLSIGKPVFASVAVSGNEGAVQVTAPIAANQWVIPVGIAVSETEIIINGAGAATAVKITSEVVDNLYADVALVDTNTLLTNANSIVLATGGVSGITVTLPSPAAGKIFNIKKVDADVGTITIDTTSGLIDGSANKVISSQYDSLGITSDGTNFYLI